MFLKLFIYSFLISSASVGGASTEHEGWYPVRTVRVAPDEALEIDPSIWVLFSKSLGQERFMVRFPGAPQYRYEEDGSLAIQSGKEEESFLLTVYEKGERREDLHYRDGEKWVHEHFVQTPHHFYHFKSLSNQADSPHFSDFISSFSIEENGLFF